jgi:hypothetical protein
VRYTDGPLLVLAGAGSGKTRVIAQKIAHLITQCAVAPEHIAAITFTNKAAHEMNERVAPLLPRGGRTKPWISTFHRLGLRILREEYAAIGYRERFTLFDMRDVEGVIADIAGGYGHTLAAILQANPQARGILFDVPDVLKDAPAQLEADGVGDRVELVPGDFHEAVPGGADLYLLKHVVHDWDDERARAILANVRDAMGENGRILIADIVLPEGDDPHFGKIEDLEMLLIPGGIERTDVEFHELVEPIGLKVERVVPTSSLITLVELVRA